MRREPLLTWWLARVFPFLVSPFHSQRPSHPSTASRQFLLFKHLSPFIHCHCPFLLFKQLLTILPSPLLAILPSPLLAILPSPLLAILPSLLPAILPSSLPAILPSPLPTILLSCSRSFPTRDPPLPAILRCYSPSCANVYSHAFPILHRYQPCFLRRCLAGAYHPSLLLAIPLLTIVLSYSRSLYSRSCLRSFSATHNPSPLLTILLRYSRSCANGCLP